MHRSIRFPDDLAEQIADEAARQDRSFNWVVVKTLEKALGETGSAESAAAAGTSAPSRTPRAATSSQARAHVVPIPKGGR